MWPARRRMSVAKPGEPLALLFAGSVAFEAHSTVMDVFPADHALNSSLCW